MTFSKVGHYSLGAERTLLSPFQFMVSGDGDTQKKTGEEGTQAGLPRAGGVAFHTCGGND